MKLRLDEAVELEEYLWKIYQMSLSEDWSESDAQMLIMEGGELYKHLSKKL
jgi:hypothetical protein